MSGFPPAGHQVIGFKSAPLGCTESAEQQAKQLTLAHGAEAPLVEKRNSCAEFLTPSRKAGWTSPHPSHPFRHRIALVVEMRDADHIGGAWRPQWHARDNDHTFTCPGEALVEGDATSLAHHCR